VLLPCATAVREEKSGLAGAVAVSWLGLRDCRRVADSPNCNLCLVAASKRYIMAKLPLVAKAIAGE
jgi:hypothetical protein